MRTSILVIAAIAVCFLAISASASSHHRQQHPRHVAPQAAHHHTHTRASAKHTVGDYLPGSVPILTNGTFSSNVAFNPPLTYQTTVPSVDILENSYLMTISGTAGAQPIATNLEFVVNKTNVWRVYFGPLANTSVQPTPQQQTLTPVQGYTDLFSFNLPQQWSCQNSLQSYLLIIETIVYVNNMTIDYPRISYLLEPYLTDCYTPDATTPTFTSVVVTNPSAAFIDSVTEDGTLYTAYFSTNTSSQQGTTFLASYPSKEGYLVYGKTAQGEQGQLQASVRTPGSDVTQFQSDLIYWSTPDPSPISPDSCGNFKSLDYLVSGQNSSNTNTIQIQLYDFTCYQWRSGNFTGPDTDTGVKKVVIIGLIIAIVLVLIAIIVGLCIKRSSGPSSSDAYHAQV